MCEINTLEDVLKIGKENLVNLPDKYLLKALLISAGLKDIKRLDKKLDKLIENYYNISNIITLPMELNLNAGATPKMALLFAIVHACANKIAWENLN